MNGENQNHLLKDVFKPENFPKKAWIKGNTAILVAHGIGRQRPLETLDMFARPMLEALCTYGEHEKKDFTVTHLLKRKSSSSEGAWFDNVIRIEMKGSPHHIDVYEYYWAHEVGERVPFDEVKKWARRTADEAKKYYDEQVEFGTRFEDSSLFFKNGTFNADSYYLFLILGGVFLPRIDIILDTAGRWLGRIPVAGTFIEGGIKWLRDLMLNAFSDYIADIVAYNSDDPNCNTYAIRKNILRGAVGALRYLIEPEDEDHSRKYQGILIAAHSLGTEITFDAINRINHLASQGEIRGMDASGRLTAPNDAQDATLDKLILGFVTFGSPLDKIAFFFRERSEKNAYIRAQMLRHFHAFKQRDWQSASEKDEFQVQNSIPRLLDDIPWRNYHDAYDPISGRLDYYHPLVNLDCEMVESSTKGPENWWQQIMMLRHFSHSMYWDHQEMYGDFLSQLVLQPRTLSATRGTRRTVKKTAAK